MDTPRAYMARAQERARADDFGEDGFREGLERLVHALEHEAGLSDVGHRALGEQITTFLAGRLRLQAWFARHPHAADRPIAAPLIGLGLPRTASSALSCLLGEDPAARSLLTWEAITPFAPEHGAPDGRIALAQAAMARRAATHPRLVAMLPTTAQSPSECQTFMAYDFKSQLFAALAHVPSYTRWLFHEADLTPTYRLVRRVLQMLQGEGAGVRWRLKNPSHSLFIEALDAIFPDARFVMTHRAPSAVVGSVADLYTEFRGDFTDRVDLSALGRETGDFCELAMRRMIAFRDAGREARFFDVHFAAFQADPMAAVERLYAFLGEALSIEARTAMQDWWRDNAGAAGEYRRTPAAAFGLDPAALAERFRFYTDRFGPMQAAAPQGAPP